MTGVTGVDSVSPAHAARRRPRLRWAAPVVLFVGVLLSGCAGIDADPQGLVAAASTSADPGGQERSDGPWTANDLRQEFEDFAAGLPGEVKVAWAPGGSHDKTQTLGTVRDEDAWSTAKVPLGVARLRLAGGKLDAKTADVLRRAIVNSDNGAARTLWRGLGTPEQAVSLMDKVVRDAADNTTMFSAEAYGRTSWTTSNQAQFAAGLPCIADGPTVLKLMDEIATEHRWGLANGSAPARFKGGWGLASMVSWSVSLA